MTALANCLDRSFGGGRWQSVERMVGLGGSVQGPPAAATHCLRTTLLEVLSHSPLTSDRFAPREQCVGAGPAEFDDAGRRGALARPLVPRLPRLRTQ